MMIKNNPEIENYEVVYARDDEGNQYDKVIFTPSLRTSVHSRRLCYVTRRRL